MDTSILVAVISAAASLAVAAITFFLTKKKERESEWQQQKLNHYKILFSALSDLAVDGTDKQAANMKFALAANTIALVAPQHVIKALMAFHDEVKFSNQQKSVDRHDDLLKSLLLAVRKDIGRAKGDKPASFVFHLIGSAPK